MRFAGVIPIVATPFRDDESPDLASLARMIRFMAGLKVDAVTILGVLGEANRLTDAERDALVGAAVDAAGTLPVIVGTSHAGTAACIALSRRAAELGAAAVMVAPGKEAVPSDERVAEHFRRVAAGQPLPIVLQDHPASTEVHMGAPLIAALANELPAIAGIKAEAVPTAPKVRALKAALARPVPVLAGLGALYAPFDLAAGCDGFNTGFAFPEVLRAMLTARDAGDMDRVHALYARYAALIVFEQQPGLAVRKEILRLRGLIDSSRVRFPGATATAAQSAEIAALVARAFPGQDLRGAVAP